MAVVYNPAFAPGAKFSFTSRFISGLKSALPSAQAVTACTLRCWISWVLSAGVFCTVSCVPPAALSTACCPLCTVFCVACAFSICAVFNNCSGVNPVKGASCSAAARRACIAFSASAVCCGVSPSSCAVPFSCTAVCSFCVVSTFSFCCTLVLLPSPNARLMPVPIAPNPAPLNPPIRALSASSCKL